METKPKSLFDRLASSAIVKLAIMFILVLLLLIPLSWVEGLIRERKQRYERVGEEIAMKWGRQQVVNGPVMAIPVEERQSRVTINEDGTREQVSHTRRDWIMLLPSEVDVSGDVSPETLKRGIYESVVYLTELRITGRFGALDMAKFALENSMVKWNEAKLVFGISDLKGLSTAPSLNWGGHTLALTTADQALNLFEQNLVADIALDGEAGVEQAFDIHLQLRGSQSLNFLPLATQTSIQLSGNWPSPSFNGAFLPDERTVGDTAFDARWSIPGFSRKQPQQWRGDAGRIYSFSGISLNSEEAYGYGYPMPASETSRGGTVAASTDWDMVQVNFLPEVNHYQKTTRVAKYGILVVLLTFASLFFTEIIKKQRIHLVQYVLIGAAMVLFYSLLLAISEHLGFNLAYFIAALATTGLIASFIKAITRQTQTALVFGAILGACYGFIYVLMQLKDFSLVVGTVGVFAILAALMYFSTRINWFQFEQPTAKSEE